MKKIRVLIVDDSFFMRNLLGRFLSLEKDIEIVGEAKDGEEALKKIKELKPDVVTLDYVMPKLNGFEVIKKIKESKVNFPAIIMVSAYTKEGGVETLKCLKEGAIDFVLKPSGEISVNIEESIMELVGKIRVAMLSKTRKETVKIKKKPTVDKKRNIFDMVVIGASTGGPPVLEKIISNLPEKICPIIFVVQHMPKKFTTLLAKHLNKLSLVSVTEANDNQILEHGRVYIAPGDFHSKIKINKSGVVVRLTREPKVNGLRPSIDVFMKSAVKVYNKGEILGIILTGMGHDGLDGMYEIKKVNGHTIAQNPETAAIDSMPISIIKNGFADEILTPNEVVDRLKNLIC